MAPAAALLGAGAYGLQAYGHSSGQASVLDEGLYLYKGLLYASGRYWPFQDGGPWTNHMPLSFLVPGWVQLATEPGLRTGRIYALALQALLLLAVWILGRRLGGRWWGAGAVAMLAANSFLIKIYSQAISQGLVAVMLAWALVFTLGPGRRPWEAALGGFLAGALVVTRVNLLPVLPLLLGYVFWEHGRRAGWAAAAAGLSVLAAGHAVFWPGILKLWAYWLPEGVTPFLNPWRELSGAQRFWETHYGLGTRVGVFFGGVLRNLFGFLGVLLAALCWPRPSPGSGSERRSATLLLSIFGSLLLVHAWAALAQDYCTFCFSPYLGFFSFSGILLLCLAVGRWSAGVAPARRIAAAVSSVLLGLWASPGTAKRLASLALEAQLPRMKEMRLLPGTVSVDTLLYDRYGLAPAAMLDALTRTIGLWRALLVAGTVLLLATLATRGWRAWGGRSLLPWLAGLSAAWLGLLSLAHGSTFTNYDCGSDVIGGYERVGAHLQKQIPPGSRVYWAGGLSPVPLLYLPQAQIYPAQLNGDYSLRVGGDPASLQRFGFWNAEMAQAWLQQADYALVEEREFSGWLAQAVSSDAFDELQPSPAALGCRDDSRIHVYRRVK